jgi:hypothetical protein
MGFAVIHSSATQTGLVAGLAARGEFHCTDCGYGITVHHVLPPCPMCQGADWKPWSHRRLFHSPGAADMRA